VILQYSNIDKKRGERKIKIIKKIVVAYVLIMLILPVFGMAKNESITANELKTNYPENHRYIFCRGFAFGEIKDYTLNPIAKIIYMLKEKPSFLRVIMGKITIQQDPEFLSLELSNPANNNAINYYGNITITFFASYIRMNMNAIGHCQNCTFILCQGFFGYIHVEKN
jgi:hypothetical protein